MTAVLRRIAALSAAAALLSLAAGCRGAGQASREEAPAPQPPPSAEPAPEPLGRTGVTLYFPSATGDGLAAEPREIFATASPEDRAKQILSDLITGPVTDAALPALPAGTRLRQVYVLKDGTAYADFSMDLISASGGGSTDEILSVYAVVDSIALNVPGIVRVGILVEGRPCETLNGHLDLRRPLRPDPTLIERPPAEAAPPGTGPPQQEAPPTGAAADPIEA